MMLVGNNPSCSTREEIRNLIRCTIMYNLETITLSNVGPEDMLWLDKSDFKHERTDEDTVTLYLSDMRSSVYVPREPVTSLTQLNEREYNKKIALEISNRFKVPLDTCISAVSKHCDLIRDRYVQLKNEYNPSEITLDNIGLKIIDDHTYTITNKVLEEWKVEQFEHTMGVTPDRCKHPRLGVSISKFSRMYDKSRNIILESFGRGYCRWSPPRMRNIHTRDSVTKHPMYRWWNRAVNKMTSYKELELHCSWKVSLHRLIEDVGLRPDKQYLTMIDPSKGFVPGNVYWREKFAKNDIVYGDNKYFQY